ncbi:hypothetical protein CTH_0440 [Carboxydocella thermautotrophica]|nr:hypothetical protein CTH_0440 [Carboxydocella thermautotrophica]
MVNEEFTTLRQTEEMLKYLGIDTSTFSLADLRQMQPKLEVLERFDKRMLPVEKTLNRIMAEGEYTTAEAVVILVTYVLNLIQKAKGDEGIDILVSLPEYYIQALLHIMDKD